MRKEKQIIHGVLHGWFETGTEGTYYAIQDHKFIKDDQYSYDGLYVIKPGDHLTIYNQKFSDKEIIWSGHVQGIYLSEETKSVEIESKLLGIKAGYLSSPGNPEYGQFHINGQWVHWLPTNVDLVLWYKVFFAQSDQYNGKLDIRKRKNRAKTLHDRLYKSDQS